MVNLGYGLVLAEMDPRRPDKQQKYKPPQQSASAGPGEDLTPDYMNILGEALWFLVRGAYLRKKHLRVFFLIDNWQT